MKTDTIKPPADAAEATLFLGDDWFDPLETGVRTRIRGFIEELLEAELDAALGRDRYERPRLAETCVGGRAVIGDGHRHGHRERQLMGTFGPVTVRVPRARLDRSDGKTAEWRNATIPAYQRRTKQADALIAGAYLAGTNTRRVRRALAALFAGEVGKDVVSRTWRKVKGDWDAWNARSLTDEPIIRLILDGTVVRVRLAISLLVALGVREDGQKGLLAIKNMGGESEAAWRALLDDLVKRSLKTPELIIVDGAPGLEKALAASWSDVPVQRCWSGRPNGIGCANIGSITEPMKGPPKWNINGLRSTRPSMFSRSMESTRRSARFCAGNSGDPRSNPSLLRLRRRRLFSKRVVDRIIGGAF
jgi:putative transposase